MADAKASGAFSKRGTFALVLFAALAFVAFLFLIGRGGLEGSGNNGQAHAAGTGLAGFAGLTRLLEEDGVWVERSRDRGALNDPGLLVLTPPANIDDEEFAEIIERRRTIGPTMIIAPKWFAMPAQGDRNSKPGWVHLLGASENWAMTIDGRTLSFPHIDLKDRTARWRGLGLSGTLPSKDALAAVEIGAVDAENSAGSESGFLAPLVEDGDGRMLVAYLADDGSYLDGDLYLDPERGDSAPVYGVMLVAEPDLMNNWGMAEEKRALLALDLIDIARQGTDGPVRFDLTLNGMGGSRNLLTLAFEPPFLAATLTLLLALAIAMWRAFTRFGPALRPAPAIAPGKSQLVANGAQVIARSGRMRLLREPYASLMRARIAHRLGLQPGDDEGIERALSARGAPALDPALEALASASNRKDLLRAARALRDLERTL
ncbi:DUF4350 domain-containing protein [Citromicrobium bathyomarinum]|mgnify:CR=1 FL=1|uniref:DUF4350 domain-containing protein n=1 Tax=Citromicrobium bathyomarinum TaxID=72174 RepID=UPI001E60F8F2|nr:DUF4350 domain-containing protein [Citromicrobium bathyomarinum]MCD1622975.1 DUF4350 domain-containing protein [Citromicrobium bathyomarinum]